MRSCPIASLHMASSAPISIPAPDSTANNLSSNGRDDSEHSKSNSSEESKRCAISALSAALQNSDSSNELRLGSLPVHLHHHPNCGPIRSESSLCNVSSQSMRPVSLPHPRAPFLSSRKGPKEKLSSMPAVTLPESSVSTITTSRSHIQYGSLRESYSPSCHSRHRNRCVSGIQSSNLPDHRNAGIRASLTGSSSVSGILSRELAFDVKVIEEGCREINCRKDYNDHHFGGEENYLHCEMPPLSNSLTALDVLTRTRDLQTALSGNSTEFETPSSCGNVDHNPRNRIHCADGPDVGVVNDDNSDKDTSPDTFEAFDLELDG